MDLSMLSRNAKESLKKPNVLKDHSWEVTFIKLISEMRQLVDAENHFFLWYYSKGNDVHMPRYWTKDFPLYKKTLVLLVFRPDLTVS